MLEDATAPPSLTMPSRLEVPDAVSVFTTLTVELAWTAALNVAAPPTVRVVSASIAPVKLEAPFTFKR